MEILSNRNCSCLKALENVYRIENEKELILLYLWFSQLRLWFTWKCDLGDPHNKRFLNKGILCKEAFDQKFGMFHYTNDLKWRQSVNHSLCRISHKPIDFWSNFKDDFVRFYPPNWLDEKTHIIYKMISHIW